ncbi:DUF6542 domain-containing protein [Streptomyces chartreusis]|uniref:DUF6542 domain-containing protein n=1 Tax=Streptomyces chartreusis TaxID=1969 RepID=UPI0037216ADB
MERGESRTRRGEGRFLREGDSSGSGRGGSGPSGEWPARAGAAADDDAKAAARAARAARLAKARASRDAASPRPARSTRPGPQRRPRSEQAAAVRRPAPEPAPTRRFPDPRLTGLGSGLFCGAVMLMLGYLDSLMFGSLTMYSVLFLPVCALTALWVREGDLLTAPVVVPIAFAVGLLPVAESGGGFSGHLMGLVSALATEAGWLYGGTLIAGLAVLVRRVRLIARRVAARRRASAGGA